MFSENDRKLIWDKFSESDYKIQNLKSIVQNPVEISQEDLSEWNNMMNCFISDLIENIVNT
jgi:hypothetical protein